MIDYFAEIVDGLVIQVITVDSINCDNLQFPESEPIGQQYILSLGIAGEWLQTSPDGSFRKNYAGTGWAYSVQGDVFVSPQPFPSWSLDENYDWQPPVPYPSDGKEYTWDEATTSWIEVTE
jgi:hypothetical protein